MSVNSAAAAGETAARTYLDRYFGAMKVRVYWGNGERLRARAAANAGRRSVPEPRPDDGPYVGPRPFDREDRARFFGRDHEARMLRVARRRAPLVLLYAASGAGKTSLLERGRDSAARGRGWLRGPATRASARAGDPSEPGNPYLKNLLSNLARAVGVDQPAAQSLAASSPGGRIRRRRTPCRLRARS